MECHSWKKRYASRHNAGFSAVDVSTGSSRMLFSEERHWTEKSTKPAIIMQPPAWSEWRAFRAWQEQWVAFRAPLPPDLCRVGRSYVRL